MGLAVVAFSAWLAHAGGAVAAFGLAAPSVWFDRPSFRLAEGGTLRVAPSVALPGLLRLDSASRDPLAAMQVASDRAVWRPVLDGGDRLLPTGAYALQFRDAAGATTRYRLHLRYLFEDGTYPVSPSARRGARDRALAAAAGMAALGGLYGYLVSQSGCGTNSGCDFEWLRRRPVVAVSAGAGAGAAVGLPVSLIWIQRLFLGRLGRRVDPNEWDEQVRKRLHAHTRVVEVAPGRAPQADRLLRLARVGQTIGEGIAFRRPLALDERCLLEIRDGDGKLWLGAEIKDARDWGLRDAASGRIAPSGEYEAALACDRSGLSYYRLRLDYRLPDGRVPAGTAQHGKALARALAWNTVFVAGGVGMGFMAANLCGEDRTPPYEPCLHHRYGYRPFLQGGALAGLLAGVFVTLGPLRARELARVTRPIRPELLDSRTRETLVPLASLVPGRRQR